MQIESAIVSLIHAYLMYESVLYIIYDCKVNVGYFCIPLHLFSSTERLNKLRSWIEVNRLFFVDTTDNLRFECFGGTPF